MTEFKLVQISRWAEQETCEDPHCGLWPSDDGEWVRFDDVAPYLQAHDGEVVYWLVQSIDRQGNTYKDFSLEKPSDGLVDWMSRQGFTETKVTPLFNAPPRVVDVAELAEIIQNFTGCGDTDSIYAAQAIHEALEKPNAS